MASAPLSQQELLQLSEINETIGNLSVEEDWTRGLLFQQSNLAPRSNESDPFISPLSSTTTTKRMLELNLDDTGARIVIDVGTPLASSSEEALLNRSSVLFVAISFILLMVISLAWLVFYYVQRFRYLHSKERVSRRLAELAKKAVARIPVKTIQPGDREINSELDQCAICIEPYRQLDVVRVLPCRHYFHKLCIDPWLLEHRSCPMCKLDILQAYGLRTDFHVPSSSGDVIGGATTVHLSIPAGSQSGLVSSAGSDDGMERVALIHSHSIVNGSGDFPHSPLTYVVLTTAATTGLSSLYYVRRPSSEGIRTATASIDTSRLTASSNQVVVSLLSTSVPNPSTPQTSNSYIAWNPDAGSITTTPFNAVPVQYHGTHCSLIDPNVAVPNWPVSIVGLFSSQPATPPSTPCHSLTTTSSRIAQSDVTFTTQAFRTPVCSILSKREPIDSSIAANAGYVPACISHSTVATHGPLSSMPHHTAIPSVEPSGIPALQCPVTIPSTDAQFPDSLDLTVRESSSQKVSTLNPSPGSFSLQPESGLCYAGSTNRRGRSSFTNWLFSSWRRTRPQTRIRAYSTASDSCAVMTTSAFSCSVPCQSASKPLIPIELTTSEAGRCVGSEHIVYAVVETEPLTTSGSLDVISSLPSSDIAVSTLSD